MSSLQRVVGARRRYNQWVANETLEDYALRYTAREARKWSAFRVCNTALGGISFLACEAVGGVVTMTFGFTNTLSAIAAVALLTFLTGLPISFYATRFGVDMDLLTRGAGFGYIGSTVTSLIYACFTFILFAVEATIMSQALHMCLGIPMALGHVISALLVIPIAAFGIRAIGRFQMWTQPIWLVLQFAPLIYLIAANGGAVEGWRHFPGAAADGRNAFDLHAFGLASAILLSFLPQIGEQVDYLRFMPEAGKVGKPSWWLAMLTAGPGWIVLGAIKLTAGSFLAYVALRQGLPVERSVQPTEVYRIAFFDMLGSNGWALALTGLFVVTCQTKINVTNAYAGSIAWSNFFARLTHSHPGRVVWMTFNVLLALMLMEVGIFDVIDSLLGLYANFAVGWVGALTADLIVNKPLGFSPPTIEFRRAYLRSINPVGVGAMSVSVLISTTAMFGLFGHTARSLAPFIGFVLAFSLSPVIAWATKGRYYVARPQSPDLQAVDRHICMICQNPFEHNDIAHCTVYDGAICSLCCSLDSRCHDRCKTAEIRADGNRWARMLPTWAGRMLSPRTQRFFKIFGVLVSGSGAILSLIYFQYSAKAGVDHATLRNTLEIVFVGLLVVMGLTAWTLVLAQESRHLAEEESARQTEMLMEEINAHERTDAALKKAKEVAEAANLAKTRFIVGLNHEIRSLLNSINGYAQLLESNSLRDPQDGVRVIRHSSEHITKLMDELLDISRIEAGTLRLYRNIVPLHDFLDQVVNMVRLQASAKEIEFRFHRDPNLPASVFTDEKRLRQILLNLLTNAIKYTKRGHAGLEVKYRGQIAEFIVSDTGIGIAPEDIKRIFEPFERGNSAVVSAIDGTGLGLTIASLLAQILGGELTVSSEVGQGSTFRVRLMLNEAPPMQTARHGGPITGYGGERKSIMVCDDDASHINLIRAVLEPLGFTVFAASSGAECLARIAEYDPQLLILDINMPEMTGWDVAREIRRNGDDELAILMVSAEVLDLLMPVGGEMPHDDHLTKPIEIPQLLERIQVLLDIDWVHDDATGRRS